MVKKKYKDWQIERRLQIEAMSNVELFNFLMETTFENGDDIASMAAFEAATARLVMESRLRKIGFLPKE